MKLIRINPDHYIIVDESKQPVEGYYYDNFIKDIRDTRGAEYGQADHCWLITHSTQPLEGGNINYENRGKEKLLFDKIQQLSLSEVRELLGEADVEKMATSYCKNWELEKILGSGSNGLAHDSYVAGYNQALEDNNGKVYTEEDVLMILQRTARKYFNEGREYKGNMAIAGDPLHGLRSELKEFLQYLQPPTSWDVEFINGKLKLL